MYLINYRLIFYDAGERKGIKYQGRRDLVSLEEFILENIVGVGKKDVVSSFYFSVTLMVL